MNHLGLLCGLFLAVTAAGEVAGETDLRKLHERVESMLDNSGPEQPFYLDAVQRGDRESGVAALYIPQTVATLGAALSQASAWCNILPLHINVKACTYDPAGRSITVYMGRKHYQPAEDAFELVYQLETEQRDNYFRASATAGEGPLKTSDYRIELEFLELDDKTFGRIYVASQGNWLSEKAMNVYLTTLGRDKPGIKVVGRDPAGNPVYSEGAIAVAERNLVRYYFAFMAYFNSADETDPEQRYERELQDWFDRTQHFPQLYEMDRQSYLDAKRRERLNQLTLQAEIDMPE